MKKEDIINEINKKYHLKKAAKHPYMAPELLPQELKSDQAKVLMEVFAELIEQITEKNIFYLPMEKIDEYNKAVENGTKDEFLQKYKK